MSETDVQHDIREALGRLARNVRLFRNNRGAFVNPEGRTVRFGLGDPGGSDLIGWTTIEVTPEMVGLKIAQFTVCETKKPGGKTAKKRLEEQTNFINAVIAAGGRGCFARSVDDALRLVGAK